MRAFPAGVRNVDHDAVWPGPLHLEIGVTGANLGILLLAIITTGVTLVTFVFTTLIQEPASIAALVGILVVSIAIDLGWSARRDRTQQQAA